MSHTHSPEYRFCPRCGHSLTPRSLKAGEPDRLCCDSCEFVFYLDPKLAAGVLVTYQERLILLRRGIEPAYGAWVFPGGFVDRGEHPEQAAAREAREEAGIEVRVRDLVGIYNYPPGNPVVLIVYQGELMSGEPLPLDESLEVGLFPTRELPWSELAFATTHLAVADWARRQGVTPPDLRPLAG
jgi:ADP-ribose pyrophosphatase YjhB (NUDIX family)